jgi:hypothetical protein
MGAAEIYVQAGVHVAVLNKSKSSSWMLNFLSSNIRLAKRIPPGRINSDHTNEYNTQMRCSNLVAHARPVKSMRTRA